METGPRQPVSDTPTPSRKRRRVLGWSAAAVLGVLTIFTLFHRDRAMLLGCSAMARYAPTSLGCTVAWSAGTLAELGPEAIPELCELIESPDLSRAWPGGAGLYMRFRDAPKERDRIRALLEDPRPRVRAAAAMVMICGNWHDPGGLPTVIDGLHSPDRDIRFFSAYYLACYPIDQFTEEVPETDRARVVKDALLVLFDGLDDHRPYHTFSGVKNLTVNGWDTTVAKRARNGLADFIADAEESSITREQVERCDAEELYAYLDALGGSFFQSQYYPWTRMFELEPTSPVPPDALRLPAGPRATATR